MTCRCWPAGRDVAALGRRAAETARLMLGVPAYEAYLAHARARHPDSVPLERDEYFRLRQAARYGAGLRCC